MPLSAAPDCRALDQDSPLQVAFAAASPRVSPAGTPAASLLVHGVVLLLWVGLTARAMGATGLGAWAAGVFYVVYDSVLICLVVLWNLGTRRRPPTALTARPTLTVLVAAHNEADSLPRTLRALLAQSDPAEAIVIADDGSSDATPRALAAFGLTPPGEGRMAESGDVPGLAWLRLPRGGKARALNAALPRISTDLVVTVDADTLLDVGALAALRDAFTADARLVAATGVLTPLCPPTAGGRFFQLFQTYEYVRNFLSRRAFARVDGLLLISGAFAGFRRSAVMAVGGFDPACMVEDYELIHRLRRHSARHRLGWTTDVLGEARATTEAPAAVAAFLRQRRRWFSGFLQTQLWYRDMVANPRYGAVGLLMLPIKAVDTLQPIFGLTALALFAAHMACGHVALLPSVAGIVAAKLALDVAFTLWGVALYRRWAGAHRVSLRAALVAVLLEPFLFQALRHLGAAAGWWAFMRGQKAWGVQTRHGEGAPEPAVALP